MLFEDIGVDRLKPAIKRKLTGLKIAPFYGCYILRPKESLGLNERPERKTYLEQLIALLGAEPVEYRGSTKCCGFPMLTFNREKSLAMGGNHIIEAKDKGADSARYAVSALPPRISMASSPTPRVLSKDDRAFRSSTFRNCSGSRSDSRPKSCGSTTTSSRPRGALEKVELKV